MLGSGDAKTWMSLPAHRIVFAELVWTKKDISVTVIALCRVAADDTEA